jgi:hypothetical protein
MPPFKDIYHSPTFKLSLKNQLYIFKEGLLIKELNLIKENKERTVIVKYMQLNCK